MGQHHRLNPRQRHPSPRSQVRQRKSRPRTPPPAKEKAKSKAAPDFNVSNDWGWICPCGVVNRTPSKTCEACLGNRTVTCKVLRATHWVCSTCSEPNKVTRFTCLGCLAARTAQDQILRNVQPADGGGEQGAPSSSTAPTASTGTSSTPTSGPSTNTSTSTTSTSYVAPTSKVAGAKAAGLTPPTGSPSTSTTSTTTGDQPPIPKAAPPKATTAHFLLSEDRHLLLASGGYVTRRTREFILPREFVDYLDSVRSPFLGPNLGVVPEQEFRRTVRGILEILQQHPRFFEIAARTLPFPFPFFALPDEAPVGGVPGPVAKPGGPKLTVP